VDGGYRASVRCDGCLSVEMVVMAWLRGRRRGIEVWGRSESDAMISEARGSQQAKSEAERGRCKAGERTAQGEEMRWTEYSLSTHQCM
jgi:hypothetical protein